jgi:glucan phosphoethanolaminetransferase (alkaline phosphatase superfamily)
MGNRVRRQENGKAKTSTPQFFLFMCLTSFFVFLIVLLSLMGSLFSSLRNISAIIISLLIFSFVISEVVLPFISKIINNNHIHEYENEFNEDKMREIINKSKGEK